MEWEDHLEVVMMMVSENLKIKFVFQFLIFFSLWCFWRSVWFRFRSKLWIIIWWWSHATWGWWPRWRWCTLWSWRWPWRRWWWWWLSWSQLREFKDRNICYFCPHLFLFLFYVCIYINSEEQQQQTENEFFLFR